jgi:hypothetical protein
MIGLFVGLAWTVASLPVSADAAAPPATQATVKTPTVKVADRAAIRGVIQRQLDAFMKDDGATAFNFSTPALRQRFGNPVSFMKMVREAYQPVYRPSQISFGAIEDVDGIEVQHLLVVGADGNTHEALYFMERQKDDSWLIAGCVLRASELIPT